MNSTVGRSRASARERRGRLEHPLGHELGEPRRVVPLAGPPPSRPGRPAADSAARPVRKYSPEPMEERCGVSTRPTMRSTPAATSSVAAVLDGRLGVLGAAADHEAPRRDASSAAARPSTWARVRSASGETPPMACVAAGELVELLGRGRPAPPDAGVEGLDVRRARRRAVRHDQHAGRGSVPVAGATPSAVVLTTPPSRPRAPRRGPGPPARRGCRGRSRAARRGPG